MAVSCRSALSSYQALVTTRLQACCPSLRLQGANTLQPSATRLLSITGQKSKASYPTVALEL